MAKPSIREVNWNRDIPGDVGVPQGVRDRLSALSMEHTDRRKELDILRKTRGQRDVGSLKTPVHLTEGMPMDATGVKPRGDLAPVLSSED